MKKWVIAIFDKTGNILDEELFESLSRARKHYTKIERDFYKDGEAVERILLEGFFDDTTVVKKYLDFDRKAVYVDRKRYEHK